MYGWLVAWGLPQAGDPLMSWMSGTGHDHGASAAASAEELEAAIDEFCTFDADAVRDFTADVKKNGGEFSIGFWVKPLGDESLMSAEKFYPHVTFFGSLSAPRPQLQLGKV
jgi:hypothetical protein